MNTNSGSSFIKKQKKKQKRASRDPKSLALIAYPPYAKPYRLTIRNGWTVPDEIRVVLPYSQTVAVTSTSGVPQAYLFNGNGCFDPDQTGVGSQPEGYDEWSALFQYYRCIGSRIRVKPNITSSSLSWIEVVVAPVPQTVSIITAIDNLKSAKYAKDTIAQTNTRSLLESAATTAQVYGKSMEAIEADDLYSGATGSNPGRTWNWQLTHVAVDRVSTAICTYIVELEFDVVFFSRKALALS